MKRCFVLSYFYYDEDIDKLTGELVGVYSQKQFLYAALCELRGWDPAVEIKTAFLPSGKPLNYRRMCDETRLSPEKRVGIKDGHNNMLHAIWECPVNHQPVSAEGQEWWHNWIGGELPPAPPSHWDDDEDYPVEDWVHEVSDDNTRQSYRQWVLSQKEAANGQEDT